MFVTYSFLRAKNFIKKSLPVTNYIELFLLGIVTFEPRCM